MEKLSRNINTELKDLATTFGRDFGSLKNTVEESSINIGKLRESVFNSEADIRALKESAERELNILNEKIHEVDLSVASLQRWSILINNKLANEYVQLSTFKDKTKSQDKIADYLMWAVITDAFVILGLIFYLYITKVI